MVVFRLAEDETEIDFVLVIKGNQWFLHNVRAIPWGV